jgi:anthranilate synthase component 2|tara:strand:- start:96195 stop:96755 length:561 start_codon:yes stop_codon:yes gene_type:complete
VKILLIDNFDSFTFNLSHYLVGLGAEVTVIRENEYKEEFLLGMDRILLSPGPGLPRESKGMMQCINDSFGKIPILGVCLGMQALVEFTGGSLFNQKLVKHGVQEYIDKKGDSKLLKGISNRFQVGLYHSWAVELQDKSVFEITSTSATGIIMSIESKEKLSYGVQFHPESIMTPEGKNILKNFLEQ